MPATAAKSVLIVDDEAINIKLFSKAFVISGFQCDSARSAAAALEILERKIPDIILSDYHMPGMNGFEFRKVLMDDPRWQNIPFIFLTSQTDQEMMLKGLNLRAIDYIPKKTPIEILVPKVSNILRAIDEEYERSVQELKKAAESLNLRSVPQLIPEVQGFSIEFWHKSFQNHPGGDFIDFISINKDYTFILLGDIMGKKWGAWVFSFSFLSYIRSAVRLCVYESDISTASILKKINYVICNDEVLNDVLSSLTLVLIDHKKGKVSYSGAGDLPLIKYSVASSTVTQVKSDGLLLGMFEDGLYEEQYIDLAKGDRLLIVSDGMVDFAEDGKKTSDYSLFINTISPYLISAQTFGSIKEDLFFKNPEREQIDDCSIIIIEKTI